MTDCSLTLRCNAYIDEKGEGEGYEGDEDSVSEGVWCGGVVLSGGIQKEWLCIVLSSPHLWI